MERISSTYAEKGASGLVKSFLAIFHFTVVCFVVWYLFGSGRGAKSGWLSGVAVQAADFDRRLALALAACFYFTRTLLTLFIFMKRRMRWSEASAVSTWIFIFDSLLAYLGTRVAGPVQISGFIGIALLLIGSAINTVSEAQRFLWKRQSRNAGHLFIGGLFQYARHINYFGEVTLFVGWAMIAGNPFLFAIPSIITLGFVFLNIPAQDKYLAARYGIEFESYAKQTARLIPYLY